MLKYHGPRRLAMSFLGSTSTDPCPHGWAQDVERASPSDTEFRGTRPGSTRPAMASHLRMGWQEDPRPSTCDRGCSHETGPRRSIGSEASSLIGADPVHRIAPGAHQSPALTASSDLAPTPTAGAVPKHRCSHSTRRTNGSPSPPVRIAPAQSHLRMLRPPCRAATWRAGAHQVERPTPYRQAMESAILQPSPPSIGGTEMVNSLGR
jgi:hypothetical protein